MSDDEIVCSICYDDGDANTRVRLDCGHAFHARCACEWFRHSPVCPMCRDNPVVEPLTALRRCSVVRRFASSRRAPLFIQTAVHQLRDKERRVADIRKTLRTFRAKHIGVLTRFSALQRNARLADDAVTRAKMRVGVLHCEELPLPPLRSGRHRM